MKAIKLFIFLLFALPALHLEAMPIRHQTTTVSGKWQGGGGGDDKEKKGKGAKEKGGKKEKDASTKDAKTNGESIKPSQHARASAKAAMQSAKVTQQQMMARAKVRNFFHNMFNTKYGKPVNFRNTRARNNWSKGHKWH